MRYRLRGQVVEQVGVLVVVNVIEIHEAADDVVLEPRLLHAAFAEAYHFVGSGAQELHPEFIGYGLKVQTGEVQLECVEAGVHLALRHHQDSGNVDCLLNHQFGRLFHDGRNVRLLGHPFHLQLGRGKDCGNFPHHVSLDFGVGEAVSGRHAIWLAFELLDDGVGRLGNLLLRGRGEHCFLARRRNRCGRAGLCGNGAELAGQSALGNDRLCLLLDLVGIEDDGLHANLGVGAVGLVHDLLELVMSHDAEAIDGGDADALAVGQAQSATD